MAIFTNQATLSYNNITTNSNVATGELLEVLSISKTPISTSYALDENVTYAISIINSGTTPITGVTVTDDLGAYAFGTQTLYPLSYESGSVRLFLNGILQPTPTVAAENPLTLTGITIPAGGNALILYEANVTDFAPLDATGVITNTVTATGTGISAPVEASATINVENGADLSITKTISPAIVTENSRVTYTFIIQNSGNEAATVADNAAVSDTFSPILTDLTVSLNGTSLTEGVEYNYDDTTGLFTTVPGIITVPAASYVQNPTTGIWEITPGTATLTVVGTI